MDKSSKKSKESASLLDGQSEQGEKSMTIFRNNYEPWCNMHDIFRDNKKQNNKSKRRSSESAINADDNITHIGWTGRIKYAVEELDEENAKRQATKDELFRDSNRLLEITISTVILMAMNETVPDENYVYTTLYLQNIRDDFGDLPPNISKILHIIRKFTRENNINWDGALPGNNTKSNVTLTKFTNKSKSRIPVRSQRKAASEAQLV